MESMAYITQKDLELRNILEIAESYNYKTDLFTHRIERLNITVGNDPSEWWQWFKIPEEQMIFDDDEDYKILRELSPKTIFAIQYHPNTLPTLADFFKTILRKYGGWVECRASMKKAFTIENIDMLVSGCP